METKIPSKPSAVALPTRVVALPDEGPEGPIHVRLAYVHPAVMATLFGKLEEFATVRDPGPRKLAQRAQEIANVEPVLRNIAKRVVLEPAMQFPVEEGAAAESLDSSKAHWLCLSFANQQAIAAEAYLFSIGSPATVRKAAAEVAAAEVATFPQNPTG